MTANLVLINASHRLVVEERSENTQSASARLLALAGGALRRVLRPEPRLDLETMPDHMKRDIGFLDGRGPRFGDGCVY
jgi:hypothetical protein